MNAVDDGNHLFEVGLNALSGIGGVQTCCQPSAGSSRFTLSLNALSGIGGVQTDLDGSNQRYVYALS